MNATSNIAFHIGKESGDLSKPPFRAYISRVSGDSLVEQQDYSEAELAALITGGAISDNDKPVFCEALRSLQNLNGCR